MSYPKLTELYNLQGKTALVTGGSRGLGLTTAEALLLAGASKVFIASRKASACDAACAHLNKFAKDNGQSGQAFAIPADVSDGAGAKKLYEGWAKLEPSGKLDILVANAGASWGESFDTYPDSAVKKLLDINVRGVFLTIQVFAKALRAASKPGDPSRVLITGSVAGIVASTPNAWPYSASKAGAHALGKHLSLDLAPHTTVNMLAPGFFPSKMTNGLLEVIGESMTESNPLKRLGQPDDLMGTVIFLCSRAGAYINGSVVPIDGGAHNKLGRL